MDFLKCVDLARKSERRQSTTKVKSNEETREGLILANFSTNYNGECLGVNT